MSNLKKMGPYEGVWGIFKDQTIARLTTKHQKESSASFDRIRLLKILRHMRPDKNYEKDERIRLILVQREHNDFIEPRKYYDLLIECKENGKRKQFVLCGLTDEFYNKHVLPIYTVLKP